LPEDDFLVGPVRNMLQAFDLNQIKTDLQNYGLVLIEIHPTLWPKLVSRLQERMPGKLVTASVFMTAVDPVVIASFKDEEEKAGYISSEVYKMLLFRQKDEIEDIKVRAHAAAGEILEAISPAGSSMYARIIHSSPEGPDGQDDWTREAFPAGQARKAIEEFIELYLISGQA